MGLDIYFYKFHPNGIDEGVKHLPKYGDVVTTPHLDSHIDYESWNKLHPFFDLENDYEWNGTNGEFIYYTNKHTKKEIKIPVTNIPWEYPSITHMARVIEVGYFREGYGIKHTELLGSFGMGKLWEFFENNIKIDEYDHPECLTKEEFLKLIHENKIMWRFPKVVQDRTGIDVEALDYDVVYISW